MHIDWQAKIEEIEKQKEILTDSQWEKVKAAKDRLGYNMHLRINDQDAVLAAEYRIKRKHYYSQ